MSTVNPYSYSEQYERILMMGNLIELENQGLIPCGQHIDNITLSNYRRAADLLDSWSKLLPSHLSTV